MEDVSSEKPRRVLSMAKPAERVELNKTIEADRIRQSFSYGRSRTVAVAVKKRVTFTRGEKQESPPDHPPVELPAAPAKNEDSQDEIRDHLTQGERKARQEALRAAHSRIQQEPSSPRAATPEVAPSARGALNLEAENLAASIIVPQAPPQAPAPQMAPETPPEVAAVTAVVAPAEKTKSPVHTAAREDGRDDRRGAKVPPRSGTKARLGDNQRRKNKLSISRAMEEEERMRSLASLRRQRSRQRGGERKASPHAPTAKISREVLLPDHITLEDLASRMAERVAVVRTAAKRLGLVLVDNKSLMDSDSAELVIGEFGHRVKRVVEKDLAWEHASRAEQDSPQDIVARPPVVTVMGHVDHGKTTLLDYLRQSRVAAGEAGGITQNLGAYQTTLADGRSITFIDTPGHAAFSAMRARGAHCTDIVILVVAADDGPMPQTVEAINHARAAATPLVVAINKMDLADADSQRVQRDLLQHDVITEEMGGDTLCVPISAHSGENIPQLLEAVSLQAELLELRANPKRQAKGLVLEVRQEHGRGTVLSVLITDGTLARGGFFVAGSAWGRVRLLSDEQGRTVKHAGPSAPVQIVGAASTPFPGDPFTAVADESRAKELATLLADRHHLEHGRTLAPDRIEEATQKWQEDTPEKVSVNLIIKADTQGAAEALAQAMQTLPKEQFGDQENSDGEERIDVRILHRGVGAVSESDVDLAAISKGCIIAFNVRTTPQARAALRQHQVTIFNARIIYEAIQSLTQFLNDINNLLEREEFIGSAEVLEIFAMGKTGKVAGCTVKDGLLERDLAVRVLRNDVLVHTGTIKNLRRFKNETQSVNAGLECGVFIDQFNDIHVGDRLECYRITNPAS